MLKTRAFIRQGITGLLILLLSGIILPVVSEFFIELAKEQKLYEHPTAKVVSVMDWLTSMTASPWFLLILGITVGGAVFMWIDYFLRLSEATKPLENEQKQPNAQPFTLTFIKGVYERRIIKDGHMMLSAKIRFHFSADNVDVFLDLKRADPQGGFRRFKIGSLPSVYENQETVFDLIKARKTDARHYHDFVDRNGQNYDSHFVNQSSISEADDWFYATTIEYDARIVLFYGGNEYSEYFKIFPSRTIEDTNPDRARAYIPNVKTRDEIKRELAELDAKLAW